MATAILAITILSFFALGCGVDADVSILGETVGGEVNDELPQQVNTDLDDRPPVEAKPRDSRLAEGEIYRVHLTFGDAMSDGGWYSVEIENPRNNWRDLVRWDCLTDITEFEEDYRFYDFAFKSDNFNTQDPALMDGQYSLWINNGFGYGQGTTLEWRDGQLIDGGYAEYSVP